jgi:hypothetical protein
MSDSLGARQLHAEYLGYWEEYPTDRGSFEEITLERKFLNPLRIPKGIKCVISQNLLDNSKVEQV